MNENFVNADDSRDWHSSNQHLFNFVQLHTKGSAASYFLQFQPEEGMPPDRIAAWKGLVSKHKNSTRLRKMLLQQEITYRVLPSGQHPGLGLMGELGR